MFLNAIPAKILEITVSKNATIYTPRFKTIDISVKKKKGMKNRISPKHLRTIYNMLVEDKVNIESNLSFKASQYEFKNNILLLKLSIMFYNT